MTATEFSWSDHIPEPIVFDIQSSIRFGADLVGFEIACERPEEGFAFLRRGLADQANRICRCRTMQRPNFKVRGARCSRPGRRRVTYEYSPIAAMRCVKTYTLIACMQNCA